MKKLLQAKFYSIFKEGMKPLFISAYILLIIIESLHWGFKAGKYILPILFQ